MLEISAVHIPQPLALTPTIHSGLYLYLLSWYGPPPISDGEEFTDTPVDSTNLEALATPMQRHFLPRNHTQPPPNDNVFISKL